MRILEVDFLGSQGGTCVWMCMPILYGVLILLSWFCKLREFELWWGFCEQVVWSATANLRSFQKPVGIELEHFFW